MPAVLADLDEYFSPGLVLTVRGKKYTVPLPDAELGLWCQRIAQAAGALHAADTKDAVRAAVERINRLPDLDGDMTLPERVMGGTYAEMVADEVPFPYLEFCGATTFVWITSGEEAATRFWTTGGRPEALGPANRQERRAQTGGKRTGAGAATNKRVSSSGTKSQTTSAPNGKARPKGQ